jgi:hypothetical protein
LAVVDKPFDTFLAKWGETLGFMKRRPATPHAAA